MKLYSFKKSLMLMLLIYFLALISAPVNVFSCEPAIGQGTGVLPSTVKAINTCVSSACIDFFYLRDVSRSGITTDLYSNLTEQSYEGAYLYGANGTGLLNYENVWNDTVYGAAVDAHDYAGKTYSYLFSTFGRTFNEITGSRMTNLVDGDATHYIGQGIVVYEIPTGLGYYKPSRAIDTVAHEFFHGISSASATGFNNDYLDDCENAALSESFSDIMGIGVKRANRQTWTDDDWMVMKDMYTGALWLDNNNNQCAAGQAGCRQIIGRRNVKNPLDNRVRCLQPDYYGGQNWCVPQSQTGLHCGSYPCDRHHVNAGVPNKMFYLLSEGGTHATSGVYVQKLGMTTAVQILYKANQEFWRENESMYGAMVGMVGAASRDYGSGSNEVRQVKLAWTAVGVGNRLTMAKAGDGNGTISKTSAYLGSGYSKDIYPLGDAVTFTATPDSYSVFAGWLYADCGGIPPCEGTGACTLYPDTTSYYNALFVRPKIYVTKTGTGSGTVSGPGISCGSDCSETYLPNVNVTLNAAPDYGSLFTGWSGQGCSGTGTSCTVALNNVKYVTATFDYDYSSYG